MKGIFLFGIFISSFSSLFAQNPEPVAGWDQLAKHVEKAHAVDSVLNEHGLVIAFYRATITKKGALTALELVDEGPLNSGTTALLTDILQKAAWKPGLKKGKPKTMVFEFSFAIERRSSKAMKYDSSYRSNYKELDSLARSNGDTTADGRIKDGAIVKSSEALGIDMAVSLSRYPGGDQGFINHVSDNFNYPKRCLEANISGSVIIQFTVNPYGRTSKFKVVSESQSCPEFTEESIRVLRLSERWIPAVYEGHYISSYRQLPISINIQ